MPSEPVRIDALGTNIKTTVIERCGACKIGDMVCLFVQRPLVIIIMNMRIALCGPAILFALITSGGCERPASKGEDSQLLALKSKCREDGQKVRAEWMRTYFQDTFSDEPEYGYSSALKTCLWIGEYQGPGADWEPAADGGKKRLIPVQTHVKFILDIYSNKTLIECTQHNGKQIGEVSEADFKRRKAELLDPR